MDSKKPRRALYPALPRLCDKFSEIAGPKARLHIQQRNLLGSRSGDGDLKVSMRCADSRMGRVDNFPIPARIRTTRLLRRDSDVGEKWARADSQDLRDRVINAALAGTQARHASARFGIGDATAIVRARRARKLIPRCINQFISISMFTRHIGETVLIKGAHFGWVILQLPR
jgi:hypothetical protein